MKPKTMLFILFLGVGVTKAQRIEDLKKLPSSTSSSSSSVFGSPTTPTLGPAAPEKYKLTAHPALRITPEQVEQGIKSGNDYYKKKKTEISLLNSFKKQPKWVRGKQGTARQSAVWCYDLNLGREMIATFTSLSTYSPSIIPEYVKAQGYVVTSLKFDVSLQSLPKMGKDFLTSLSDGINHTSSPDHLLRQANEAEVKATKFVLSDDKGHFWEATDQDQTESSQGTMTYSGQAVTLDSTRTTRSQSSTSAYAHGSNGAYATGTGSTYGYSTSKTYKYEPWSQSHPYYEARYNVSFSLIADDGSSRIAPDAKKLTLHIITPVGEMAVDYDLTAPKVKRR